MAVNNLEWHERAACINMSIDLFFPDVEPTDKTVELYVEAKEVCGSCPVRHECLAYAMGRERDERWRYGLWGGLTPHERWLYDPNYRLGLEHK